MLRRPPPASARRRAPCRRGWPPARSGTPPGPGDEPAVPPAAPGDGSVVVGRAGPVRKEDAEPREAGRVRVEVRRGLHPTCPGPGQHVQHPSGLEGIPPQHHLQVRRMHPHHPASRPLLQEFRPARPPPGRRPRSSCGSSPPRHRSHRRRHRRQLPPCRKRTPGSYSSPRVRPKAPGIEPLLHQGGHPPPSRFVRRAEPPPPTPSAPCCAPTIQAVFRERSIPSSRSRCAASRATSGLRPSCPRTMVVTPWARKFPNSGGSGRSQWAWASMNPGARTPAAGASTPSATSRVSGFTCPPPRRFPPLLHQYRSAMPARPSAPRPEPGLPSPRRSWGPVGLRGFSKPETISSADDVGAPGVPPGLQSGPQRVHRRTSKVTEQRGAEGQETEGFPVGRERECWGGGYIGWDPGVPGETIDFGIPTLGASIHRGPPAPSPGEHISIH